MKTKKTEAILGCLTDGKAWHVLQLTLSDNGELSIHSYITFASPENVIINTIPNLLTVIK